MKQQVITCTLEIVQIDMVSRITEKNFHFSNCKDCFLKSTIEIDEAGIKYGRSNLMFNNPVKRGNYMYSDNWTIITHRLPRSLCRKYASSCRHAIIVARKKDPSTHSSSSGSSSSASSSSTTSRHHSLLPPFLSKVRHDKQNDKAKKSNAGAGQNANQPPKKPYQYLQNLLPQVRGELSILKMPPDQVEGVILLFSDRQTRQTWLDCIVKYTQEFPKSTRTLTKNPSFFQTNRKPKTRPNNTQHQQRRYSHALFEDIAEIRVRFAEEDSIIYIPPKERRRKTLAGWFQRTH